MGTQDDDLRDRPEPGQATPRTTAQDAGGNEGGSLSATRRERFRLLADWVLIVSKRILLYSNRILNVFSRIRVFRVFCPYSTYSVGGSVFDAYSAYSDADTYSMHIRRVFNLDSRIHILTVNTLRIHHEYTSQNTDHNTS